MRAVCGELGAAGAVPGGGQEDGQQQVLQRLDAVDKYFPFYVLPASAAISRPQIEVFETLMGEQLLEERSEEHTVAFISQSWLSKKTPDLMNAKFDLLQAFLQGVSKGEVEIHSHWLKELIFGTEVMTSQELTNALGGSGSAVWIDYSCLPQSDPTGMMLACQSIPYYIDNSDYFILLQPVSKHELGHIVDVRMWASRGWCRAERFVNMLSPQTKRVLVVESLSMMYIGFDMDWLTNPVGLGAFTVDSDRRQLGPVLEVVIRRCAEKALKDGDFLKFRMMQACSRLMLEGTGWPEEHRLTADEWMQAMRFTSAKEEEHTGWTPLRFAMYAGRLDVAAELLTQRADIEAPLCTGAPLWSWHTRGTTILAGVSFMQGSAESIEFLLRARADPWRLDNGNNNSLTNACLGGHVAIVEKLLQAQPGLVFRGNFGTDPVLTAALFGHASVLRHLYTRWPHALQLVRDDRGNNATCADYRNAMDAGVVRVAVLQQCDISTLKTAIQLGYAIDGQPDLRYVSWAMWGLVKFCQGVYSTGSSSSLMMELFANTPGSTPLATAALSGKAIAVRELLAARADPGLSNCYGRLPLHFAALKGQEMIIQNLLEASSPVGLVDSWGYTASQLAQRSGSTRIRRMLEIAGDVPPAAVEPWVCSCAVAAEQESAVVVFADLPVTDEQG